MLVLKRTSEANLEGAKENENSTRGVHGVVFRKEKFQVEEASLVRRTGRSSHHHIEVAHIVLMRLGGNPILRERN